jgi:tRNA (cmo5U34)-methyltransferase
MGENLRIWMRTLRISRDSREVSMAGGTWKRDDVAAGYLSERSHFIPDRPRQLEVLVRVVRSGDRLPSRILDLGAGDGVLLECFLEAFPEATGVAVDFSLVMVEQARRRLKEFGSRATVAEADLGSPDWLRGVEPPFDAIVSGLAIHHLTDDRKRALYREVFDLLRPRGTFLNCEHVASRGPWGQGMYDDAVSEHLWGRRQEHGDTVSLEEVRTEYVSRPDRADNILALVEDQCGWLREIGFQDVDCFWKYFELAIFGRRRS